MSKSKRLNASAEAREDTMSFLAGHLETEISPEAKVLILNDRLNRIHLQASARWCRFAYQNNVPVLPSSSDLFDSVVYRLDANKKSGNMYLQLAASRMKEGATLWMIGANDEGVKSTAKHLEPLFKDADTFDFRRRARIIRATRTSVPARGEVDSWQTTVNVENGPVNWVTFPGLFAGGGADAGTELLCTALSNEKIKPSSYVCDWGCGSGLLSHSLRVQYPDADVLGIDADYLAVEAYRKNISDASAYVSDGWANVPSDSRFDLICSNPPMHIGKSEDFRMIQSCIQDAPSRLRHRGALYLVVLRQIPVQNWLGQHFSKVEMIAENNRYWVWRAVKSK